MLSVQWSRIDWRCGQTVEGGRPHFGGGGVEGGRGGGEGEGEKVKFNIVKCHHFSDKVKMAKELFSTLFV